MAVAEAESLGCVEDGNCRLAGMNPAVAAAASLSLLSSVSAASRSRLSSPRWAHLFLATARSFDGIVHDSGNGRRELNCGRVTEL